MTPLSMMSIWMVEYQIHYWKDLASTQILVIWRQLLKQMKYQMKGLNLEL